MPGSTFSYVRSGWRPSISTRASSFTFLQGLFLFANATTTSWSWAREVQGSRFVYRQTSPNSILISGGKTTVPQLFGYLNRRANPGLIPVWDVVAFDEVSGIEFTDSTAVQMLKDYMESGPYSRGKDETPAEASMVYLGNTELPPECSSRRLTCLPTFPGR